MADGLKLGTSDFQLLTSHNDTDTIPVTRPGDQTYEATVDDVRGDNSTPWQYAHSNNVDVLYRKNKVGMVELIVEAYGDDYSIALLPAEFSPQVDIQAGGSSSTSLKMWVLDINGAGGILYEFYSQSGGATRIDIWAQYGTMSQGFGFITYYPNV